MNKSYMDVFKEKDKTVGLACNEDYTKCQAMRRLFAALKYYSMFNIMDNEDHREIVNKLMENTYDQFINDYIHFNNHHTHEIETIHNEIINNNSLFTECNIKLCSFTTRHHRNNTQQNLLSKRLNFFKKTMDSLHFHLFHCFDVGIRIKTEAYNTEEKSEKAAEKQKNEYFDGQFFRTNKMILDRQHITKEFDRFSPQKNNKFSIQTTKDEDIENKENETLFLDTLYEELQKKNVSKVAIQTLHNFVLDQQYDSETVAYDMEINNGNGNIGKQITNDEYRQTFKKFIQLTQHLSTSFNVGLRFYYWKFYKGLKQLPQNEQMIGGLIDNSNDHSGYEICDLYVSPKYRSFKEEISEYDYFTFKEYEQDVIVKVNEYINSKIVKATRAGCGGEMPYMRGYGIKYGTVLDFNNLVSLILYCDYSGLSRDFSASFRAISRFETIGNIKKRNSKYYYLSKYLRETVEVYGQCSRGYYDPVIMERFKLLGPFYCGINILLNMAALNIRLCGPTSTSVHKEVAIKFGDQNGIIIKFNNPAKYDQYCYLRGFNVSWISRFSEEAERLFFGGFYYMKIVSVTVINTKQNFEKIIRAIYYVDLMITGGELDNIKVTQSDISVVKTLFDNILTKMSLVTLDKYANATFQAFTNNKKIIILCLDLLENANEEMRDVLMYPLNKGRDRREDSDFSNICRPEMFEIFNNIDTIIIHTYEDYSISMVFLLSLLDAASLRKVTVKARTHRNDRNDNWIYLLWEAEESIIKKQYNAKKYTISIRENAGADKDECWFLIKSQILGRHVTMQPKKYKQELVTEPTEETQESHCCTCGVL